MVTRTGIGSLRACTVKTPDHRAPQRNTERSETNGRNQPICIQKRKKSSAGKLSGPPGFTFTLDRSSFPSRSINFLSLLCRLFTSNLSLPAFSCHSGSHGPHQRHFTSPSRCISCPQTGLRFEDMTFFSTPLKTFSPFSGNFRFLSFRGGKNTTQLRLTS